MGVKGDVDGTVMCTGPQVQRAFRGFNLHHRKHLSYYPLLAHVAQTGTSCASKTGPATSMTRNRPSPSCAN
jgi:hypothetical protein